MERLKKYFNSAVAVMLLLVTATVNVACDGDDDEDKGGSQKVYVKTVKMSATVEPTADLLNLADITLSYTDDQGANVTQAVTSEKNTLNAEITKFPANGTVTYTLKLKTNANIDASKSYKLSKGVKINLTSFMSDGKKGGFYASGSPSTQAIPGNKVEEWLSENATKTYSVKIDKDGGLPSL